MSSRLNTVDKPIKADSLQAVNPIPASVVVDGRWAQTWASGSCVHTGSSSTPHWLLLDLQDTFVIDRVEVLRRMEADENIERVRFRKTTALISNNSNVWTSFDKNAFAVCSYYEGPPGVGNGVIQFPCSFPKVSGRFISIYKDYTTGPLPDDVAIDICEIHVYAFW